MVKLLFLCSSYLSVDLRIFHLPKEDCLLSLERNKRIISSLTTSKASKWEKIFCDLKFPKPWTMNCRESRNKMSWISLIGQSDFSLGVICSAIILNFDHGGCLIFETVAIWSGRCIMEVLSFVQKESYGIWFHYQKNFAA